jgi:transposase
LFVERAETFCEWPVGEEEAMATKRVTEALWQAISPLLPEHKPSPKGGRPPVPDRVCLEGIIFVLKTGMPWQMLPTRLGYGSGSTCWRRLHAWTQLGIWPELHRRLLRVLGRNGRLNLERAVIDSASVRALKGGHTPARTRRIEAKMAANVTS